MLLTTLSYNVNLSMLVDNLALVAKLTLSLFLFNANYVVYGVHLR